MADPAVCSFITKILCSNGGCLDYKIIPQYLDLSDHQLEQILQDWGNERFLVNQEGASRQVLAVTPVRLCLRHECGGCERLHVCKNYIKGRCYRPTSGRGACKYSHDVFSEENRKVLKNHELSGLNEDELRVLLLQNDPFLLPDVCRAYNRGDGNCPQQDNCPKLHVCHYFIRGQCRFPRCKRSHSLVNPTALKLLLAEGVDDKVASNIQRICEHKTSVLFKEIPRKAFRPAARGVRVNLIAGNRREHRHEPTSDNPTLVDLELGTKASVMQNPTLVDLKLGTKASVIQNPTLVDLELGTKASVIQNSTLVDLELGTKASVIQNSSYFSIFRPATSGGIDKLGAGDQKDLLRPEQASLKVPLLDQGLNPGVKVAHPLKPQSAEKKKIDEICLYYVWRFCKNKNDCSMVHYHLPYRWQINTGVEWKDCDNMEEIEKAYCDPRITSFPALNINFRTMLSYINIIRRLSTPSSVTKPDKFVMTTKWLWYWKNDQGQWIEYGKQDGQRQASNLCSDDLENVFLADPNGTIQFQAGSQHYEINFKDMTQRNIHYLTQRELRRRPKFVSPEDVKKKKGHTDHASASASASTSDLNYPKEWDKSALPDIGYKAIEVSKMSPEYLKIEKLFQKTMSNYVIYKMRRIQNPSLWQVFQWQKDQMKKKKGGGDVNERLLFHGTNSSTLEAICNENFDWRICGTNGTVYGKGSYFARDAQYSHNYCQRDAKMKTMFVAQVLVGDFVTGHATYTRPPAKSTNMINCYDSCVDRPLDPSIFIIFEKHQIYPAYMIDYFEEEKKCIIA